MADNALVERDLEYFLQKVGGSYVAAYNEIVADQEKRAFEVAPRSNADLRKSAYAKAIKTMDRKEIASMNKTVRAFLPLAKKNSVITATSGALDPEDAEDLMVEILEVKRLSEIANSRYEEVRKRVFSAITEKLASQGVDFPEFQPGFIEVPKLGLKFAREGGGRKDPELDESKLESLVGPDVWEKVTTVETIPAQEVRTFNVDLFLMEARRRPVLLEKLRSALVVGEFAPSRFQQRPMEPTEE